MNKTTIEEQLREFLYSSKKAMPIDEAIQKAKKEWKKVIKKN